MKIVVTGGAGFIGSAVCRYLVQDAGAEVVNVDKLTYAANLRSLDPIAGNPRYTFIRADICDRDAMDAVFAKARARRGDPPGRGKPRRPVDQRLGRLHPHQCGRHPRVCWRRRAPTGCACRPSARTHSASCTSPPTRSTARSGPEGSFSEETAYDPSSPYSASKAAADHLAGAWHRTFGLPVVISNCSNNYGPYHFPEKLIPLIILNASEEKPLPVYGDGSNVRDWLYVEDHARALCI